MEREESTEALPDGIASDDFFAALTHPRRQRLLSVLCTENPSLSLTTVADLIATQERGLGAANRTNDGTKQVRSSLIHRHLPVLEETGLIEYDDEAETVHLAVPEAECTSLLSTLTEEEPE